MQFVGGAYKRKTDVQYSAALSKKVRAGVSFMGTNLRPLVEQLVDQFEQSEELCKSLKVPGYPMRQVDLRPEPGHPTILLKVFMSWRDDRWLVMIEGADETVFENGEQNF